jgi:hypothetical protein
MSPLRAWRGEGPVAKQREGEVFFPRDHGCVARTHLTGSLALATLSPASERRGLNGEAYDGARSPSIARASAGVASSSPITSMMSTAFSTSAAFDGASLPRAR